MAADEEVPLIDALGLARLLGVSTRGVYRLAEGGLPHYRVGGQLRFDPNAVFDHLKRGEQK